MTKRLSRRAVMQGAGGLAIALPWLEIMGTARTAHAKEGCAKRFVTVYTPGGSVTDDGQGENRWRPSGTEDDFTLSSILAPLESVRDKLLVMDGLAMRSAIGEQHQAGIIAWLCGTPQGGDGYAQGPSVDQVIANLISRGFPRKSLQMAVRWGTGSSHGLLHPINTVNFEDNETFDPIPPRLDPQAAFDSLFGAIDPDNGQDFAARLARKKSILDFVDRRFESLAPGLGSADRQKLEQHLEKIRELETSIGELPVPTDICLIPERIDTSDYDPQTGLNSEVVDSSTDEAIPKVGRFMSDMTVMALACEITPVASLQWTDTEAKHTFPWLGLDQHHHYYQHDGGFRPAECEQIATWYSEQHAHLLQSMDAVEMEPGVTLLDESVVFFGTELGHPSTHAKTNMPFLLAGGGGGMRGGRFLRNEGLADDSHNNLLVAILNLFGDARQVFGSPEYCSGPYVGLS